MCVGRSPLTVNFGLHRYALEVLAVCLHSAVMLPAILLAAYTLNTQNFYAVHLSPEAAAEAPLDWLDLMSNGNLYALYLSFLTGRVYEHHPAALVLKIFVVQVTPPRLVVHT